MRPPLPLALRATLVAAALAPTSLAQTPTQQGALIGDVTGGGTWPFPASPDENFYPFDSAAPAGVRTRADRPGTLFRGLAFRSVLVALERGRDATAAHELKGLGGEFHLAYAAGTELDVVVEPACHHLLGDHRLHLAQ